MSRITMKTGSLTVTSADGSKHTFEAGEFWIVDPDRKPSGKMKGATDNARDLGRNLTRRYNRVRQSAITTELMEVISGAAALG